MHPFLIITGNIKQMLNASPEICLTKTILHAASDLTLMDLQPMSNDLIQERVFGHAGFLVIVDKSFVQSSF